MLHGYITRFNEGLSRELTQGVKTYRLPEDVRKEALFRIEVEQKREKEAYDKARFENVKYDEGDIVLMRCNPVSTGQSPKLQSRFKGLLVTTAVFPSGMYQVFDLTASIPNCNNTTTTHVSQQDLAR